MLARLKIDTPCLGAAQLIEELRDFLLRNTTFSDMGVIGSNSFQVTFKSPENYCYNFDFKQNGIETYISRTKPNREFGDNLIPYNYQKNTMHSLAKTTNFKYPILTRNFFTNGKLVVMVLEVESGVFRHHAFGKFDTFGNVDGGEFVGGTAVANTETEIKSQGVGTYDYQHPYYFTTPFTLGWSSSYATSSNYQCRNWIRRENRFIMVTGNSINTSNNERELCMMRNTPFYGIGSNHYNGRVPLYPILWNVCNPLNISDWEQNAKQTPTFFTDLVCLVDVKDHQPEDILNNEWVVFPLVTKIVGLSDNVSTTNYGVAYKIRA